jgi:small GTP-binding protein
MSENEDDSPDVIKAIVVGETGVGKTNLINAVKGVNFNPNSESTISMKYFKKTMTIYEQKYKIKLWDTAGQETFRSLTKLYYNEAKVVLLVYDITNKKSFESIPEWIKSIRDSKGENFPMILLGNKLDKEDIRVISEKEGKELADEYGIKFFETSNKTGVNIQESGMALVNEILKIKENEIKDSFVSKSSHNSKLSSKRTTLKSEEKRCC